MSSVSVRVCVCVLGVGRGFLVQGVTVGVAAGKQGDPGQGLGCQVW